MKRAASILTAISKFRKKVCSGDLPQEMIRNKPLCSAAYKYMFNACRIPESPMDSYTIYDPSLYSHCIIAHKGFFFEMDFVDKRTHEPLPIHVLEESIRKCIDIATEASENKDRNILKLGMFTSLNRDDWAEIRDGLLKDVKQDLEVLQSGAMLICIDDDSPSSRKECAELFWHGGKDFGMNRWFDKSLQFICTTNGKAGLIGEHSMMDGMPTFNLCRFIHNSTYKDYLHEQKSFSKGSTVPVRILFDRTSVDFLNFGQLKINNYINAYYNLVNGYDVAADDYKGYGSHQIKALSYSPDAFVQQAIQLASIKVFGRSIATYESTQVRSFLHGRLVIIITYLLSND